jgi:hypothetical protein
MNSRIANPDPESRNKESPMSRRTRVTLALTLAASLASASLLADVRSEEKSLVRFEGVLGRMVNLFGGRAAREGVTTTVAVKGNRKAIGSGGNLTQIVDLDEEKIYDIDARRKEYKVTTFAEVRRQMEEARRRAEEDARKAEAEARKEQGQEPAPAPDPNAKELEADLDVKETGQKKSINGFDTRQFIVTVTLREKGKTLEESGGMVLTTDTWLTPAIPQMKEVVEFEVKYAQKLQGPMITGASAQDMAAAMAMYPGLQEALARMRDETVRMDGTPIQTTMKVEAVKSAEQIAAEQKQAAESKPAASPGGRLGGLVGGLARRARGQQAQETPQARATFMTTTHEVLKVATSVTDGDLAIPAGFKEAQ